MTTRYIVQRALTDEILDYELALVTDGPTHELSASGSLAGTIAPDLGQLRADDGLLLIEEWGTFVYQEIDGQIRWGGVVTRSAWEGKSWKIECAGFASYATGTPWPGTIQGADLDPLDIVRTIWRVLQEQPDSDLAVRVVGPTESTTRVGTVEEPYELVWWNTPDAGRELEQLAKDTPFDFTERHTWDGAASIRHEFVIGYPRLGRRRDDLAFEQGVNIAADLTPSVDGGAFANSVLGLGAGEGVGAIRRQTATSDGRLRRTKVVPAKDVDTTARLDAVIRDELQRSRPVRTVDSISVVDHPNAAIGAWDVGDEILVTGELPWLGAYAEWHRITSWSQTGPSKATIKLAPTNTLT